MKTGKSKGIHTFTTVKLSCIKRNGMRWQTMHQAVLTRDNNTVWWKLFNSARFCLPISNGHVECVFSQLAESNKNRH